MWLCIPWFFNMQLLNTFVSHSLYNSFYMSEDGKGVWSTCLQMSWELVEGERGGWKASVAEAVLLPCLESWEGRFLSLETIPAPYYCGSTSHPGAKWPWTWTSQLHPPSFPRDHTLPFFPPQYRASEVRALPRDRKVFVALGISFRLPKEHFTKKQVPSMSNSWLAGHMPCLTKVWHASPCSC